MKCFVAYVLFVKTSTGLKTLIVKSNVSLREQTIKTLQTEIQFSCWLYHMQPRPEKKYEVLCCDTGQNDTIGKIELNPSFVLSHKSANSRNDIQKFLQLFEEHRVNGDYH